MGNADHAHFAGGVVRRVDKALSPLAGRGVDQAAVILFHHIFGRLAAAQPHAGGVDRQHFFEIGFWHPVVVIDGDHPGVLNRDVNGAEAGGGLLIQPLHLRFVGDIDLQR